MLGSGLKPAYPGEPLLIAAGVWTKVIGPQWAERGGIAIDMGSAIDYLALDPSRPAVLANRYGAADRVPADLSLDRQLRRVETLDDFLAAQTEMPCRSST